MSTEIDATLNGGELVGTVSSTGDLTGTVNQAAAVVNEYELTVSDITGGHRMTIRKGTVTQTFDVPDGVDGEDGEDGEDGQNGSDGVSPTVTVTDITGGHRVTITDASGAHAFDVMDGEDAPDLYLKTASVSGNTLTLTKQDDTTVTYSGGSEAFVVTFTLAAGAQIPTCDRTYAEIVAAEVANKTIIGKLASSGATDPTVFAYMGRLGSTSDAELAFMHLRYSQVTMITMGFDSSIGMNSQEFPQQSVVESHMNNAEVHTSAAEKETWNGKQNAITGSTDLTANSLAADALKDKSGDHLLAELVNDEWYLGDSSAPINATDAQAFYVPQVDASGANDQAATKQYVDEQAATKVDKVTGKGLSTEDYTSAEKSKLTAIEAGADVTKTALTVSAAGWTDAEKMAARTNLGVNYPCFDEVSV